MEILKQKYQQNLSKQKAKNNSLVKSDALQNVDDLILSSKDQNASKGKVQYSMQKNMNILNRTNLKNENNNTTNPSCHHLIFNLQELKKPIFKTVNSILQSKIKNSNFGQSQRPKKSASVSYIITQSLLEKRKKEQVTKKKLNNNKKKKYNYNVSPNLITTKTINDFQIIDIYLAKKNQKITQIIQNSQNTKNSQTRPTNIIMSPLSELSEYMNMMKQNQKQRLNQITQMKIKQKLITSTSTSKNFKSVPQLNLNKKNENENKNKNNSLNQQNQNIKQKSLKFSYHNYNKNDKNQKTKKKSYPKYEIYSSRSEYHIDRIASKLNNYIESYIKTKIN